jgi:hypothetical protein
MAFPNATLGGFSSVSEAIELPIFISDQVRMLSFS